MAVKDGCMIPGDEITQRAKDMSSAKCCQFSKMLNMQDYEDAYESRKAESL